MEVTAWPEGPSGPRPASTGSWPKGGSSSSPKALFFGKSILPVAFAVFGSRAESLVSELCGYGGAEAEQGPCEETPLHWGLDTWLLLAPSCPEALKDQLQLPRHGWSSDFFLFPQVQWWLPLWCVEVLDRAGPRVWGPLRLPRG